MSLLTAIGSGASTVFGLLEQIGGASPAKPATAKPAAAPPATENGPNALLQKIQSAVTLALASLSAKNGASSASAADVNKAIEKAIVGVLNEAADGSVLPSDPAGTPPGINQVSDSKAFAQMLAAHGVNAQQFQADMKAAIDEVQQGGVNVQRLLSNFAKGSALDVTG